MPVQAKNFRIQTLFQSSAIYRDRLQSYRLDMIQKALLRFITRIFIKRIFPGHMADLAEQEIANLLFTCELAFPQYMENMFRPF